MAVVGALALLAGMISGCVERPESEGALATRGHQPPTAAIGGSPPHSHEAWWCAEHGVPEEVCGQCNTKLAADFQKKGDWCKEHDRPDSQCFKCHPEFASRFAAQYEAKYGSQPPQPTE